MINSHFQIEWYKQRRVVLALLFSMLIHGMLLALVPGWRINTLQPQPVLSVQLPELVRAEPAPAALPAKPQPKADPMVTERARSEFKLPPPPRIETSIAPLPQAEQTETPFIATIPAAPAPVPAPVVIAKAAPDSSLLDSYGKQLSSLIARYQRYPRIAQLRGWQGTAQVQLFVSAEGRMVNTVILRSSGFEVLDDQALEMVQQAAPLPQPPEALRGREFTVMVPIVFKLND